MSRKGQKVHDKVVFKDENLEELGGDKLIDSKAIEDAVKRIDEKLADNPSDKKTPEGQKDH